VVKALNHAAGFLRHHVSQELDLRVSPRLAFAADRSFEEASRVEAILKHPKVAGDIAREADGEPGDEEPGEDKPGDGDGAA
jgi:ribosome-binding factor A